jgi:amino acid transporter
MTLIMPSSDPNLRLGTGTAASSPFVLAFSRVGISGLPHVINAGVLCSAFSAASAHMYLGSRALWALSFNGRAPKIFQRTNKHGTPYYCVLVSFLFGLLAFTSAGATTAAEIFNYFANMVSVVGLISWAGIAYIYLRFHAACKLQGFNRGELMYRGKLQPFIAYYTLIFASVVVLFNSWWVFLAGGWSTADFICGYLPIPLFFIVYFGYKFITKSKQIPLELLDLHSNSAPEDYGPTRPPPKNVWERIYHAMV